MSLAPGTRLGVYEILSALGAGGMGEVYRARDTRLNREVAVKILPPDHVHDAAQKQRFLREARAASALTHPNIITVHEINSADGTDFIVMELVRGKPLSALLAHGPLPRPQAVSFAIQIADALETAHETGVVHRDLKPGNVMVSSAGRLKVLDFGLAKRLAGCDDPASMATASGPLTVDGIAMGTPAYMSPEQAVGDPVDARSDLFSLGVVLYQMLAGALPFSGETNLSTLRRIVNEPPRPLRVIAPDVPEALAAIVDKCLAKEPADRYANARQLLDALRALDTPATPNPGDATQATTIARPPAARHTRRVWLWVSAAIVVIAVMAVGWRGRSAIARWTRNPTSARFDAATATAPELYAHATDLVRAYYREGNIDRAIEELNLALQRRSPYPLAEARLSLAYWAKNGLSPDATWRDQALARAETAVRGDPQLAFAHVAHGAALVMAGRLDQAAEAYQRAATLDPASPDLLWRRGDLAVARNAPADAEQFYRRAVDAGPKEWEPKVRLGSLYYKQGRYDDALKLYETARDLAPDYPRVYSFLAAVYHQVDRTDEAAAALQRSLEIAPDSGTYSNLGTLLYFQGRFPEAVSAFERSVELGANTYSRWGNLADAQRLVAGTRAKAHESYTTAIQLVRERLKTYPSDLSARSSLTLYLVRDDQKKDGLAELDRVLEQKNLTPSVLFNSAICAELAGERPRALDLLGRSLSGGYRLREVTHEPDLVNLRTDPEYHKLVARFEK